jgi:phosphatidylserine decarboxylase
MPNKLHLLLQYLAPQHALSRFMGCLADCRIPWWKNWAIRRFIRKYGIDLTAVRSTNLDDYPNFNSFFTRFLKAEARPIVQAPNQIACPVDGSISQIGKIEQDSLLQAKGAYFKVDELLGGHPDLAKLFHHGHFATFYLAPKDYHRVHMPLTGQLHTTIYIPGKLFSVNQETVRSVPHLFARNERLVCLFDTAMGPMAVILVGAMLVGHIQTVWCDHFSSKHIAVKSYPEKMQLERGAELGHFRMGSTVIILFGKEMMTWLATLGENATVKMGELLGTTR